MKLQRQKLDRSLALWLVTAILAIAGFCMPAPASAHSGHGHGAGTQGEHVRAPAAVTAQAVTAQVGDTAMRATVSVLRTESHLACAGPCCTGGCGAASCCALGLAPAEGDPASASGLTGPVPVGTVSARTDVAPDSPSEPPRSFA